MLADIKLSEEEYSLMMDLMNDSFYSGSEGKVIRDGNCAIKLFRPNFGQEDIDEAFIGEIRENKRLKVCLLFEIQSRLDNLFCPFATYSFRGEFVGYRGQWLSFPSLEFAVLDEYEKIFYLKRIREKLEKFHELGIVYGDLKSDHIYLDLIGGNVAFIDLDNIQIGKYPIDLMSSYAENFVFQYGKVDAKLDAYMMNLLTIEQFHCDSRWYRGIIDNLRLGFIPSELYRLGNKRLVKEMGHITKNFSGSYFIDEMEE